MKFLLSVFTLVVPFIASTRSQLNGWYPCSEITFQDEGSSGDQNAECAVYSAPLCYPGICVSVDTVDIFVKRLLAVGGDPNANSNVWILQGGPGASSTASTRMLNLQQLNRTLIYAVVIAVTFVVESAMVELHTRMNGSVNVYTMDHRGTGRSTFLDCVAAQVTTTGSPSGNTIEASEVPACAQALEYKYGDLASFSMTTAATDLATLITNFSNGADTIVYGVSYGTALVERLMHLDPPEVVGYALDGIATTSGSSADKFEYFSTWDSDFGEVGDTFLALCAHDSECNARFDAKSLPLTIQTLISTFDNDPESTCAALVSRMYSNDSSVPASFTLRNTLGSLLLRASTRTLIPPVVYRLNRCASKDIEVLTFFFEVTDAVANYPNEDDAFDSSLLYYLIAFSEMWESPQPSLDEMLARFTDTRVCNGGSFYDVPRYCAFSKEKSATCNELGVSSYDGNGIIYERDQYWNKSAAIPHQASVLLLSGKLDTQTPHKYAEYLLESLKGNAKELITFQHATHGTLWTTPLEDGDEDSVTCGMKLLMSYVSNRGDLAKMDKSCVNMMPTFNLKTSRFIQYYYFSTADVYDGVYDSSLSALVSGTSDVSTITNSSDEETTYKIVFIVFLVLFVVALALAVFFGYRWHKLKREKECNRVIEDLPENVEVASPVIDISSSPASTTPFSTQRVR